MGFQKIKRPVLAPRGMAVSPIQTLSSASTGTEITNYGVTTIWQSIIGTTDNSFALAAPVLGQEKTIFIQGGARKVTITCTGTDPFYGSTDTTSIVATSSADDTKIATIKLVGVTSIQTLATGLKWGAIYLSTAIAYV